MMGMMGMMRMMRRMGMRRRRRMGRRIFLGGPPRQNVATAFKKSGSCSCRGFLFGSSSGRQRRHSRRLDEASGGGGGPNASRSSAGQTAVTNRNHCTRAEVELAG